MSRQSPDAVVTLARLAWFFLWLAASVQVLALLALNLVYQGPWYIAVGLVIALGMGWSSAVRTWHRWGIEDRLDDYATVERSRGR